MNAEDIVVKDVYCKFKNKDINENNEIFPLDLLNPPFETVPALRLDALKTCKKVIFYLLFVPYIGLSYGFLF